MLLFLRNFQSFFPEVEKKLDTQVKYGTQQIFPHHVLDDAYSQINSPVLTSHL